MLLKGLPFEAYVNYVEGKMGSTYEWNSEKASFNSLWLNYFFSVNIITKFEVLSDFKRQ